jgi:class 3 adenylate cyclase
VPRTSWVFFLGNLVGALLTFFYFRFIDTAASVAPVGRGELIFFLIAFGVIAGTGHLIVDAQIRPLLRALATGDTVQPGLRPRALAYPWIIAGVTAVGWVLAGLTWGVLWPLVSGTFSPNLALRVVGGIIGVGGTVVTALVFFAAEHQWRELVPRFFPEGDLSAVPGAPRLSVRARLLVMFLLAGVLPLVLLGVLAATRAAAILHVDPATADGLVRGMLGLIVFLLVVGIATAAGLALFVSRSVAGPLARLRVAMAHVERGELGVRAPVLGNDEIGGLSEGFNRMVDGLRDRELVKETFGKYVSPEVRDEILGGRIPLDGQLREVTILFADLRDFTPWVEKSDPRQVVLDLNAYFTEMEAAIRRHGGLVLQYIGDEIEAVFGAPVADPAHATHAVRAAVDMRRRLAAWNAARRAAGDTPLRHGIGIHTGPVVAGNIGSAERLAYTLVGDAVNLASRLQSLTKDVGCDILVSADTRRHLDGDLALTPLPALRVKGKSEEVEVFSLDTPGGAA